MDCIGAADHAHDPAEPVYLGIFKDLLKYISLERIHDTDFVCSSNVMKIVPPSVTSFNRTLIWFSFTVMLIFSWTYHLKLTISPGMVPRKEMSRKSPIWQSTNPCKGVDVEWSMSLSAHCDQKMLRLPAWRVQQVVHLMTGHRDVALLGQLGTLPV